MSGAGEASQRPAWPIDKLNALRAGQRLVAEVPAVQPGRRAFVSITPVTTPTDDQARQEGWKRADHARTFACSTGITMPTASTATTTTSEPSW